MSITQPALQKNHRARQLAYHIARYWMIWFSLFYGLFVGLPFLAPVLMHFHLESLARLIYSLYSFLCHQLPERSYFFYGSQASYPVADITAVWPASGDLMRWREFTGSLEMGWKVAWSDRMISMYTGVLLFAWLWWPLRRHVRPLSLRGFVLLLLPMVLDGGSHMISDLSGLHAGFRFSNDWLASLTGQFFPSTFYVGDALGSFNSWMRLVTGLLTGLAVVWAVFPILEDYFSTIAGRLKILLSGAQ